MHLDIITAQRSVGDFVLGIKEDDVTSILGAEHSRITDDDGDVELEYAELGLRFSFWCDYEFRLGHIAVERPTASVNGLKLHGKSKADVQQFISDVLDSNISEEDGCVHEDDSVQEWFDVDSHDLSFWFNDGSLYLIDVFCQWSDPETPSWPQA